MIQKLMKWYFLSKMSSLLYFVGLGCLVIDQYLIGGLTMGVGIIAWLTSLVMSTILEYKIWRSEI